MNIKLFSLLFSFPLHEENAFRTECREMERKKKQSVKSAAHEKTNNALSSRINNKNTFGYKTVCTASPIEQSYGQRGHKQILLFFKSLIIKCFGRDMMRSLTILVSNRIRQQIQCRRKSSIGSWSVVWRSQGLNASDSAQDYEKGFK